MISAGIVGCSGYAGLELTRILTQHPSVHLSVVTSRTDSGKLLRDINPSLLNSENLKITNVADPALGDCDVVFFATPHGVAMRHAETLLRRGVRIVDLSPDFRLRDSNVWEFWYGQEHCAKHLLDEAVYGLSEIYYEQIKTARLIANPGCYATAVQLALIPFLQAEELDPKNIIADAKSGISGAGRGSKRDNLFAEVSGNFRAYSVNGHRHHPEILQGLQEGLSDGSEVRLSFVPHIIPASRGILVTLHLRALRSINPQVTLENFYKDSCFVHIMRKGELPETRFVNGTNNCLISTCDQDLYDGFLVLVVIDNLIKGAAGQAVQNMNMMFQFKEEAGLESLCLIP